MKKDITGIILCGGKSSRMQTNKALLKISGKPVIEIIAERLKSIFNVVLISTNDSKKYNFLNLPLVNDIINDKGPLGGIYSALKLSTTEKNFIISCDMPLINVELIKYLINLNSDKAILLPKSKGRIHQLCGVYSKSVISIIEDVFNLSQVNKSIKGSVYELIEIVPTNLIDVEHLPFYDENQFLNMNSPEDYELIKNIYENQ
ncbi:MAG TPA: molybdenum cofactor guanylyltransferase [Ignavibacteriales bacterium]|nr:molybdenum cofactor guanylyltransferase [Ignavibacteriales bacterium]